MSKSAVSLNDARFVDFRSRSDGPRVVFLCRDPGSWKAMHPVIDRAVSARDLHPYALIAGWTRDYLERTPKIVEQGSCEAFDRERLHALKPAAFVTACGVSDHHLEVAARELFPDVPMLCIEDNYGQYGRLFREMLRRDLVLPEKVCCIDRESARDLAETFPEFAEGRVAVTGQPAFDGLIPAGGADAIRRLRDRFGVEASASLVSVIGAPGEIEFVRALADALAARGCTGPVYAFRQHPRDPTWPGLYLEAFDKAGLQIAETDAASVDDVVAASDTVVASGSTELVRAVYLGIPAVYVTDTPGSPPPVRVGAALRARSPEDAAHLIQMLADPDPDASVPMLADIIRRNQSRHYPPGRRSATEAVLAEIIRLLRP